MEDIEIQQGSVNIFEYSAEGSFTLATAEHGEVLVVQSSGEYSVEGATMGCSRPLYEALKEIMHRVG